jgi:hypothetical protein
MSMKIPVGVDGSDASSRAVVSEQRPVPYAVAARGVGRCVVETGRLLRRRRLHLPDANVGLRLRFADGTVSRVYRETVVDVDRVDDPCVLVVSFRLRLVRGRLHALFRRESILNTPLFVGFPGFVSKLWMSHDRNGVYRGVYEWDDPVRAEHYARCLWRVLALVSVPGSIRYAIVPGAQRGDLLSGPGRRIPEGALPDWARVVGARDPLERKD